MFAATMAAAGAMKIGFSCTLAKTADPALGQAACDDVLRRLGKAYPDADFAPSGTEALPHVQVEVAQATPHGLGLRLIWTAPDGTRHAGEVIAASAMDRPLSPSMRDGVIRRAVEETPLPF